MKTWMLSWQELTSSLSLTMGYTTAWQPPPRPPSTSFLGGTNPRIYLRSPKWKFSRLTSSTHMDISFLLPTMKIAHGHRKFLGVFSMVKMFRRVAPSTVLEACSAMRCTFLAQTVLQMSLSKICFMLYIPLLKQDHKLSRFLCFMFNIKTPVNVRPAQEVRPSLLSEEALRVRVKKEKVTYAFRAGSWTPSY